jgi:hypothetical protein
MSCTRVVDAHSGTDLFLSSSELRVLQVYLWRDPGLEDRLKSMSLRGKICPVVLALRKRLSPPVNE